MKKYHKTNALMRSISSMLRRYHFILFFTLIAVCLVGVVYLVNQALGLSAGTDDNYTSSISAGSIDQATLTRIQALHTSSESVTDPSFPDGRLNPFGE